MAQTDFVSFFTIYAGCLNLTAPTVLDRNFGAVIGINPAPVNSFIEKIRPDWPVRPAARHRFGSPHEDLPELSGINRLHSGPFSGS